MNLFDTIHTEAETTHEVDPNDLLAAETTEPDDDAGRFKMRPYQAKAVDNIYAHWNGYNDPEQGHVAPVQSTLLVLPTGCGKTVCMAKVIERRPPGRVMFLAHREELIYQGKATIEAVTGAICDVEMAGNYAGNSQIVIATVQTLSRGRNEWFKPEDFSLLVIDECFVAGTLINGRPIEQLNIGECVLSVNHGNGRTEARRITRTFKKRPKCLVRLKLSDKKVIVCTPDHPFFTLRGYVQAVRLLSSDVMLTTSGLEMIKHASADNQGREWNVNSRTENSCMRFRLADGGCDTDIKEQGKRLSDVLQGGCWKCDFESCSRGGRKQPLCLYNQVEGQEKGGISCFPRVESIEILEPGSDGTFGGMCQDGFVYNIEVEDNNNYFANGVLVHNCHHATAGSYKMLHAYFKSNPNLKVLGVTATPDRADEEALGQVFESVAFDYELTDAIHDGWLVPITARMVEVAGLDYSSIRTTAGDLNGADLAAVLEAEENLHRIASPTIELVGNRKALVFCATVAQAERMSEIFNRHRDGCSQWVCGKTNNDVRREMFKDFKEGKFQILVNVGVATEGFDEPTIECVVLARPTKSRALYSQMVGRGTRALPGVVDGPDTADERKSAIAASGKPMVEIIDFVGNAGRHQLVSTADILGGNYTDDVVDRAREIAMKETKSATASGPVDMTEALAEAQRQIEAEKEREAARRASIRAKAHYSTSGPLDPFKLLGVTPYRERGWERGKPVTEKMRACLEKAKLWTPDMSFSTARQLIQGMANRRQSGFCSIRQAQVIAKHGFPSSTTFDDARKIMDTLAKNNWRLPAGFTL